MPLHSAKRKNVSNSLQAKCRGLAPCLSLLPLPAQHSMESALCAAIVTNFVESSGDIVQMSAVSDMVNGWNGGIIQAGRHAAFVTPTYLVSTLYTFHLGEVRLASTLRGPNVDSTQDGKEIPTRDAVVSRSTKARQIHIKVVNTDPSKAIPLQISQTGVHVSNPARLETLNGSALTERTTSHVRNWCTPRGAQLPRSALFITLPEHAVSVIAMDIDLKMMGSRQPRCLSRHRRSGFDL